MSTEDPPQLLVPTKKIRKIQQQQNEIEQSTTTIEELESSQSFADSILVGVREDENE